MAVDNVIIHDTHVNKWLTPTQILQISSNIGAAKIALRMQPREMWEMYTSTGLGQAPKCGPNG